MQSVAEMHLGDNVCGPNGGGGGGVTIKHKFEEMNLLAMLTIRLRNSCV